MKVKTVFVERSLWYHQWAWQWKWKYLPCKDDFVSASNDEWESNEVSFSDNFFCNSEREWRMGLWSTIFADQTFASGVWTGLRDYLAWWAGLTKPVFVSIEDITEMCSTCTYFYKIMKWMRQPAIKLIYQWDRKEDHSNTKNPTSLVWKKFKYITQRLTCLANEPCRNNQWGNRRKKTAYYSVCKWTSHLKCGTFTCWKLIHQNQNPPNCSLFMWLIFQGGKNGWNRLHKDGLCLITGKEVM